jgi:hypothetical protein
MPDSSAPALDNSGRLPASGLPTPPPTQNPVAQFGSSLANMLPGAHYAPPDPASSALDQSASLLQQRIDRASQIATNPLAQLFAPEQVQAARNFVPQATEQLRTIAQQKAQVQAGRAQAQSMGLTPDEAPDQATQDDRIQVAQAKALKGDMRSFQGLQAVAPDHAAAIAPQVYQTIAGHLDNAQTAFDSLAAMTNEGQYQAKVNQLRQDGTLSDLESLGLKLPPSFDAFNASKGAEGLALRNARIAINTAGQQLEDRNTYQPMAKDEAATYDGRLTTAYGDKITNGTWGRNAASNTRGFINNGLATPDSLGKGGVLGNADQRTQIGKDFATAVPEKDLEKYRNFNRTYALATQDASGNAIPSAGTVDPKTGRKTFINDNPNVQQGIAEGLASMLRGGTGGATAGLLNIESDKRGAVQSVFDKIQTAYAGAMNSLTGEQVRPYLTQLTEQQQRQVLDGLKGYTGTSITDRSLAVARRAGALGFGPDALGLGKDEAGDSVNAAIEEGRQAQIARMRPNFQAIGGGDGVLQLGAQRPGASAIGMPPGAQPYNQLPGATPLLTPVQQAGQNGGADLPTGSGGPRPVPSAPQPQASGTGQPPAGAQTPGGPTLSAPQPVTVAGQQVNVALPPGASPAYVASLQRIESGGERNPWTSGTPNSSASGAFQAIKGTWDQFKPPGAPARAADATPQQQADFLSNFTAHNATALATAGLPVNDTSLYVAHNLGAGGGAKLLQADPTADARTIVGEAAARNNPIFFRGRPTVAVALQRYADAVDGSAGAPTMVAQNTAPGAVANDATAAPPEAAYLTPKQREAMARRGIDTSAAPRGNSPEVAAQLAKDRRNVAGAAPAALGTLGAFGGAAVGGPPGAVAGGVIGGGAGQALKDYVQGNAQSGTKIAEQAALSGVLGVASEARPFIAAGARMLGSGAIEAGSAAAQGGSGPDVVDAGLKGAAEGAGGEAFGRALGMAGHKVFSLFAPDAKVAVQDAAKTYAESSKVLETEPPKLPGVGGAAGTDNPKYAAAEAAQTKAEQTLKDAGLDPEEAAYAHTVSTPPPGTEPISRTEAQVSKPGELEKQRIGAGYQQLSAEVGATGVGAVKAAPKLPDGPMAAVVNKQVSAAHAELAERTEMAITAPAANWQEKWQQLQDARSNLLQAERDALSSTATGKTQTAADMRTLADTVRTQQAKAADYVFGTKPSVAPPPQPGQVRLYRGENPRNEQNGGYFTTDKDMASSYGSGTGGKLNYVDVPANEAKSLAMPGMKNIYNIPDYAVGPSSTNWRSKVQPLSSPGGAAVMQRLNALDVRYRRLMDATNGGDLSQAARLSGAAGRDADQKFKAFAAGDPTAIAAWNAMRGNASGPNYEKGVYNLVAAERIPVLGKIVSGVKLLGSFNRWMQERAAGSPAKFSDILSGLPDSGAQATRNVAGTIAQRGAVQGNAAGASP